MPGAGFKKTAKLWKATLLEMAETPVKFVRKQMAENRYQPSYVSELFEKSGEEMTAEEEHVMKWSAASLYSGGADTVSPSPSPTLCVNLVMTPVLTPMCNCCSL